MPVVLEEWVKKLLQKILSNNKLYFVGGFENKSHPMINKKIRDVSNIDSNLKVSSDADQVIKSADVLIDFTTPSSTLLNTKIAARK